MTKLTYVDAFQKHFLRERMIPQEYFKVAGLGGPDLLLYIEQLRSKNYRQIDIYENNQYVFLKQLHDIVKIARKKGISLILKDILHAPVCIETFYDLDFCCRISSVKDHIYKFRDNSFVLTVSEMMLKPFHSMSELFEILGCTLDRVIKYGERDKDRVYITDKGVFKAHSYCDTSPMLTIKNL